MDGGLLAPSGIVSCLAVFLVYKATWAPGVFSQQGVALQIPVKHPPYVTAPLKERCIFHFGSGETLAAVGILVY